MTATLPDTTARALPSQRFSSSHIGPQADDREKMLAALGLTDLEQLVEQSLPRSIRSTEPLRLLQRCQSRRHWLNSVSSRVVIER
jgi:glycine cleavage system pyridoxal-binding protein P